MNISSFSEIPAELQILILDKIPMENLAKLSTVNIFWGMFSREKHTENPIFIRYQRIKKSEGFISTVFKYEIKECQKRNLQMRIHLVKARILVGLSSLLCLPSLFYPTYVSIPFLCCVMKIFMNQKTKIDGYNKEINITNASIQTYENKISTFSSALLKSFDGKNASKQLGT